MTEKEKMIAGLVYDAYDDELNLLRSQCRELTEKLNALKLHDDRERAEILGRLLGSCGENVFLINAQFDYGFNTFIGSEFSANFNFVVLDCAPVHIGHHVLIGPNVTIAPPVHPLRAEERSIQTDAQGKRHLYEYARPVSIGNHVWIASNVVISGGVTIGDNSVIGAGSVVTKDIPSNVVAAGVPCRVLHEITEADRIGGIPLQKL